MAKPQRKNINDALAEIAAQASDAVSRDHVVRDHAGREHVERDNAPRRPNPRLDVGRENVGRENVPVPLLVTGGRDHAPRDHARTFHLSADTDEEGYRVRVRREKPHASLYAHPRVFAAIRDLANEQRRRPHDLYIEGLRLMLSQYGLDFDELDGRRA